MKVYTGKTVTSHDLGHNYLEQLKSRQDEPEKWRGLSYGHSEVDALTGGLRKGEFAIIAGAQKAGKTTAAMSMAQQMAMQVQEGELVLYVSLEMGHDQLASRILSNLSDVEVNRFRDYKLDDQDWIKLKKGIKRLDNLPMLWNVGACSITAIEMLVEAYPNIRVAVVDYFQLMTTEANRNSKRFEELENISRRLKNLATQKEISVLAISQQSRAAMRSLERQKDPNTLAGTQSLVRDCDLLLLLLPYIENGVEITHLRKINVALSRSSAYGDTFNAYFSGAYNRFGAVANIEIEEMPKPKYDWTNH